MRIFLFFCLFLKREDQTFDEIKHLIFSLFWLVLVFIIKEIDGFVQSIYIGDILTIHRVIFYCNLYIHPQVCASDIHVGLSILEATILLALFWFFLLFLFCFSYQLFVQNLRE